MERSLQLDGPTPDVVQGKCVNPTTKVSRRDSDWEGARQKRSQLTQNKKVGRRNCKPVAAACAEAAAAIATEAWARVSAALADGDASALEVSIASMIETVYDSSQSLYKKTDWIPAASQQLRGLASSAGNSGLIKQLVAASAESAALTRQQLRKSRMHQRLLALAAEEVTPCCTKEAAGAPLKTTSKPPKRQSRLADCSSKSLQLTKELIPLKLSLQPVWVDTIEGLCMLKTELQMLVNQYKGGDLGVQQSYSRQCSCPPLGFDTEWCNSVSGDGSSTTTVVATIALAFASLVGEGATGDALQPHRCWIIDARPENMHHRTNGAASTLPLVEGSLMSPEHVDAAAAEADQEQEVVADVDYHETLAQLVLWLWKESGTTPLGFAVKNDLKMLEQINPQLLSPIWDVECMDVQQLAIQAVANMEGGEAVVDMWSRQLPGLAACCAYFLDGDLDKQEQRSEWGLRPLRSEQLSYAAMDAVVLLELLLSFDRKNKSKN